MCTERWESDQKIPGIDCPILFLSADRDELIPPFMMKELHTLATTSRNKKFVSFPRGTHNDTPMHPGYFEAITNFWNRVIYPKHASL